MITWNAEVGATGEYDVELYYSSPQADVGSTVELSFNKSRLQARIAEPHDPLLRGDENDRVLRSESYVKNFKAMNLGRIYLEKGHGKLKLRAVNMPGSQVMEFRGIVLSRIETQ